MLTTLVFILLPAYAAFLFSPTTAWAGNTSTLTDENYINPNKDKFQIVSCDGPTIPSTQPKLLAERNAETRVLYGRDYVPCDFNGAMRQIQHLINLAIVVGVIAAIFGFVYAGALYISGSEKNISKAKEIFPKLGIGFILMLSAWFIIYQILVWFTGEGSGFTVLLGK